ncbi:MAG TPA: HIRAN domain-containing protein, partial [Candidatus Baltobacteraceae bacterium]|nr:HIRAN domain-containing protein [Candidatus Baltobacteraceae bacterium]
MFARRKEFLARDDFAGIGERDSFPTKVMGVSFEGRQDQVAGLVPGLELELKRQPDNPVDANAIAVHFGALHIGFLRKQIAKHLAPLIDGGIRYTARVEHVTGGKEGKNYGVNIRVERDRAPRSDAFALQMRAHADDQALRRALIGENRPHDAQAAVLARLDAGKNTLAVLGTGRGKSFCF